MSDNYDNRRNELCDRFRRSLTDGSSSQYFDEDDLIEIFDYAGDLNDDYLRFEVLLCGARYYPDSVALSQRRALLYSYFGSDITAKYLEDNNNRQGVLWDITRIRNTNPMGDDAIASLDKLLDKYDEFDDEEIIQLVDLASSLGQIDWLRYRLDSLRAHVTYLPTLLYEIAVMLEIETRYGEAIDLLEELTNIEPYNEQYWFMLAQEYDFNDNPAGALQALDLALAILPEDKAMRFYHARLLSRNHADKQRAIKSLEKLVEDFPDDIDICRFLAALLIEAGGDDNYENARHKAANLLSRCFKLNPGNRKLASDMLIVDADDPETIIMQVDKNHSPADINEWISWASELQDLGAYDKAIAILLYCEHKIGKTDTAVNEDLIVNYFMLRDFKAVCRRFDTHAVGQSSATTEKAALLFAIYAISLTKTGHIETAAEFCELILKMIAENGSGDIDHALTNLGTGLVLTDIIERAKSQRHTDWDKYDPLGVWQ